MHYFHKFFSQYNCESELHESTKQEDIYVYTCIMFSDIHIYSKCISYINSKNMKYLLYNLFAYILCM